MARFHLLFIPSQPKKADGNGSTGEFTFTRKLLIPGIWRKWTKGDVGQKSINTNGQFSDSPPESKNAFSSVCIWSSGAAFSAKQDE